MSKRRKKNRGDPSKPRPTRAPAPRSASSPSSDREATSNPSLLVYALLGVSVFLFTYLHLYALPQMTYFAGGFSMPDTRLFGYDVAYIERLRNVMDDDALGQLNFLHKTAGILFPVSCFFVSWAVAGLIMRRGIFRWCIVGLAGVFAVLDIVEGFIIDRILAMEPLDAGLVAVSSVITMVSWSLLVLVGAIVVGVAVMRIIRGSLENPAER